MKTYNTLLSDHCEKCWQDLTNPEKIMLVNSHIAEKPTLIPNYARFQQPILNTLNLDVTNISFQDLLEAFLNVRNYLFQAIKEDIESDFEKEQIFSIDLEKELKSKETDKYQNNIFREWLLSGDRNGSPKY